MSDVGRGKLVEAVYARKALLSERLTAATVYYNGSSISFGSGIMIDTDGFEEIMFVLNYGTILGAAVTLKNSVYASATDDPTAAALVTGASFTDVNSGSDEAVAIGSVRCADTNRYVCLVTEVQGSVPTIDFGAVAVLGKAKSQATTHSPVFDV